MDVTKNILLFLILTFCWVEQLFAETINKVKLIYNTVNQKGSGGYQVIDNSGNQDIIVQEPMLLMQVGLNDEISLNAMISYDTWSSASDRAFDDSTSASLIGRQERNSYNAGIAVDKKKYGYSFNLGSSEEWDYTSKNFSIGAFKSFAEDNFVFGLNYSHYMDQTKLFDVSLDETKDFQDKTTQALSIDMSQILTQNSLLLFGHHFIKQSGALEGTLNTIDINGTRTEEVLPRQKNRQASYLKLIQSVNEEQAIHLSYRFYQDDWNIQSNTFEVSWLKSFYEDDAYLEIFYRIYDQTQYKNFDTQFQAEQEFMTSDADYEKLSSNQFGVIYNHQVELFDYDTELVLGYTHYQRDNNLSYDTLQLSVGVEF